MLPFVGDNLPYISTDSYIHVSGRYACDSIILGWRYLPATASAERLVSRHLRTLNDMKEKEEAQREVTNMSLLEISVRLSRQRVKIHSNAAIYISQMSFEIRALRHKTSAG